MSPRPKNPPPDRRQEILETALRLFSTKGYGATTNADIARAAGVTTAALYYYFPSKAELFKAALTERKGTFVGNVEQMADHLAEVPPAAVFPLVVQAISGFLSDERSLAILRIILLEGPRNPEILEVHKTDVLGQVAPLVFTYIQDQMDLGRLRSMDPRILGLLVASPLLLVTILRDMLKVDLMHGLTNEMVARQISETILPALVLHNKE